MASLWQRLAARLRGSDRSPGPAPTASPVRTGKTLYVGNFLAAVRPDDLRETFCRYGTVTRVEISADPQTGLSRGFGFIEMADGAEAAIAALDGMNFRGRALVVNEAQPWQPDRGPLPEILDRLVAHANRPDGPELRQALSELRTLAETGDPDAAQELAEALAARGPHYDPEAAYKWYYVALSQQGYTVQFEDHNGTPPHYCGPEGDFRNESGVSALVAALGFDRVRALDAEAARWMADRNLADD